MHKRPSLPNHLLVGRTRPLLELPMTLKDTGCKPQAHGQAEAGGGPCPRCGRPRCCASAKSRDRERCRKNPHPGASICTNHGLTEAGRAKAAEVRAEEEADKVLAKLWNPDVAPVTDPVSAMAQLAGRLQHVADEIGKALEEGDLDGPRERAWIRSVRELRQLLDAMARLGIAERQIQLDQQLADVIVGAFRAALGAAGLLPADEQAVLSTFLGALGDVVPGEVVA